MKKNSYIGIVIMACLMFMHCKSIQVADLHVANPNANLLPALEPQIIKESFEVAYSKGTTKSTGSGTGIGQSIGGGTVVGAGVGSSLSTTFADKRVQDALIIYEREIRENVSSSNEIPKGYAVCRITTGQTKLGSAGWVILSGVTLMIPNIFGMPYGSYKTELELEIEIQDSCKKTIARYTGYGYNKTMLAAYWGYGGGSAHITGNESGARKSNIEAVKMAMAEIKQKINADHLKLTQALKECRK